MPGFWSLFLQALLVATLAVVLGGAFRYVGGLLVPQPAAFSAYELERRFQRGDLDMERYLREKERLRRR